MYKVIKYFTDLHDKDHPYNVGDVFPREGIKVTDERLAELAGSENRQGTPLIELVEDVADSLNGEALPKEPLKKASQKARKTKTSENGE